MPRIIARPHYWKWDDLKAGTKVVDKGEYVGKTPSNLGVGNFDYNFVDDCGQGRAVQLSGGVIKQRILEGGIVEGGVYDIIYQGKTKLSKGVFKGKDMKNFDVLEWSDEELGREPKEAAVETTAPVTTTSNEALDDLE